MVCFGFSVDSSVVVFVGFVVVELAGIVRRDLMSLGVPPPETQMLSKLSLPMLREIATPPTRSRSTVPPAARTRAASAASAATWSREASIFDRIDLFAFWEASLFRGADEIGDGDAWYFHRILEGEEKTRMRDFVWLLAEYIDAIE